MKVKLHKYQAGGTIITTDYEPTLVTQGAYGPSLQQLEQTIATSMSFGNKASQQQNANNENVTMKDLLTSIKDMQGLPTDVNFVINKIKSDLSLAEVLKDPITGQSPISLTDAYLQGIQYLNQVKNSKITFDNAYRNASNKGTIGEAAITSDGNVVVKNVKDGSLSTVSVQQYLNNEKTYNLQTNGDLLQLRRMDPNYKFADNILDVVENGISTKGINDFINQFSSGLGVNTLQKEGYSKIQAQRIINGANIIQEAQRNGVNLSGGIDGLFKTTKLTEDQKRQAQEAVIAIDKLLPKNYRSLLALKAGNAQNPDKGVFDLITIMIDKNTSNKLQYSINKINEKNGKKGDSDSDSDESLDKAKEGPEGQWFRGIGEQKSFNLSLDGTQGFVVKGVVGAITKDSEGKQALGPNASLQEVGESPFAKGMDVNNATFGDGMRIDSNSINKVIVDANRLVSAELPLDTSTDTPKPDFNILQKKENADAQLKSRYKIDPDREDLTSQQKHLINTVYRNYNIPIKYDENTGKLVQGKWQRFGLLKGTLTNEAILGDVNTKYIRQVEDSNEIKNYEDSRKTKTGQEKYQFDSGWFGSGINGDKLYQGTIFIPVTDSYMTMTARERTIPQQQMINQLDVANRQAIQSGVAPKAVTKFNMFNGQQ